MEMPVSKLSGGEKAKLALARQLVGLSGVDVMFLDEPTNHLVTVRLDFAVVVPLLVPPRAKLT